jgi:hypothetical protein
VIIVVVGSHAHLVTSNASTAMCAPPKVVVPVTLITSV